MFRLYAACSCKIRSIPSCDQIHIHASVRKNQQEQVLEDLHYRNAFLFVGIWGFQSGGNMESCKNLLIEFEICLLFWVACVILLFIAWVSGSMIVSEQLNYTKTWWFHAIFMPVIIEFSRCVGTYSSAKVELLNKGYYHRETGWKSWKKQLNLGWKNHRFGWYRISDTLYTVIKASGSSRLI